MLTIRMCIVYARVSTLQQNISSQIKIGLKKAKSLGFLEDQIIIIEDDGVSSLKTNLDGREGLMKVQQLIRERKVGTLIAFDRDRIARNMMEYLEFIEDVYKFNVLLVFSNQSVEEFSTNFAREADLALYAETEGKKIVSRTMQASKYYQKAPYGYRKVGTKSTTRYEFSSSENIQIVKELFHDFCLINTKKEFQILRKEYESRIPGNLEKILSNLFYAGHIIIDGDIEKLMHVKPIVEINQIKNNITKLSEWGYGQKREKLSETLIEQAQIPLLCEVCGRTLTRGVVMSELFFSCNHDQKINAPSVKISNSRINDVLIENLSEQIQILDFNMITNKSIEEINKVKSRIQNKHKMLVTQYNKFALSVRTDRKQIKKMRNTLNNVSEIKRQLFSLEHESELLDELKENIRTFATKVQSNLQIEALTCSTQVIQALICDIHIGKNYIKINNRFGNFKKEA